MRIPKKAKTLPGREWTMVGVDVESKEKLEALAKAGSLAGLLRCIAETLTRGDLVALHRRRIGD